LLKHGSDPDSGHSQIPQIIQSAFKSFDVTTHECSSSQLPVCCSCFCVDSLVRVSLQCIALVALIEDLSTVGIVRGKVGRGIRGSVGQQEVYDLISPIFR
jgi:hypothetical protein